MRKMIARLLRRVDIYLDIIAHYQRSGRSKIDKHDNEDALRHIETDNVNRVMLVVSQNPVLRTSC